jgi:hypothetical protein
MAISRFTKMDSLPLQPGHDWVSKSTVGPFVDTGVDVQFREYGRLYLSVDTIRELAEVAGVLTDYQDQAETAWKSGYDQGYKESVRDNFGADLRGAVERLTDLAGVLAVAAGPDHGEAVGDLLQLPLDGVDLVGTDATGTDGARGEGTGARRKR